MKENTVLYIIIVYYIHSSTKTLILKKKQVRRSQNSLYMGGTRLTIKHKVVSSLQPRTSASVSNLAWVHCLSIHHVYTVVTSFNNLHKYALLYPFSAIWISTKTKRIVRYYITEFRNLLMYVFSLCFLFACTRLIFLFDTVFYYVE